MKLQLTHLVTFLHRKLYVWSQQTALVEDRLPTPPPTAYSKMNIG